jgi:Cytochrome c554 and c-prime
MNSGSVPARRASIRPAFVGLVALAIAATAGVLWSARTRRGEKTMETHPSTGDVAGQPVTLIVSGDTAGWIVPCGCTSNQSGGLLRRATFIRARRDMECVVVADAGGAPGGTSDYHRLKFEAILRGELQMGLEAHNLGGPEAALGVAYLRRIEAELKIPFVSANLRDATGTLVSRPLRIVQIGDLRIAFVGVLSQRQKIAGCSIDAPRDSILAALKEARGRYDRVVILAWLPEAELRELAATLPEADAVIGGPTGQSLSPQMVGPTLIASATNKGKFLASVTIPAGARGIAWTGSAVEITNRFEDHPSLVRNLKAFRQELRARDFPAEKTGLAPPSAADLPAGYRIAGSKSCESCHIDEYNVWRESSHAHAWETLADESAFADPECQRCHTTGYGLPGGFETIASSADRFGVGCESCHGPSAAHVENPKRKTPLAAQTECRRCHDRENSPQFEFADYWGRIVHGRYAESKTRPPFDQ